MPLQSACIFAGVAAQCELSDSVLRTRVTLCCCMHAHHSHLDSQGPEAIIAVLAGYVALHFTVQRLARSQYSLLPLSQLDDSMGHPLTKPAASMGKAAASPVAVAAAAAAVTVAGGGGSERLFSREASLQDKQLALAECGGGSRGGSFTAGMRQQGGMHMRSDSANHDSVRVGWMCH